MGKRANTKPVQATQTAKKAKTDAGLASVVDAIMAAEHIPSFCRTMLAKMLPFSLQEVADKRHNIQEVAVSMMEETLNGTKVGLEAALAAEDEKLGQLKGSYIDLGKMVSESQAALADQKQKAEDAKKVLAEATTAERLSSKAFSDRKVQRKETADTLGRAQEEKAELESALETHVKPIEEGAAGLHFKELEKHLKKIEIEASLLTALPSSCTKTKETRGSFDHIVIEELKKAIIDKIEALGNEVAAGGPVSAQRTAAVAEAGAAHEAANGAQMKAVNELDAALKEQSAREDSLVKARKAVEGFQPELEATKCRARTAQTALEEFVAGPVATFLAFKTKVTKPLDSASEDAPQDEPAA